MRSLLFLVLEEVKRLPQTEKRGEMRRDDAQASLHQGGQRNRRPRNHPRERKPSAKGPKEQTPDNANAPNPRRHGDYYMKEPEPLPLKAKSERESPRIAEPETDL